MRPQDRSVAISERIRMLPALPNLKGPRVCLRGPRETDVDDVFALFSDPQTMRYWSRPPMQERAEAAAFVASIKQGFARRTLFNWLIADRGTDRVIGSCTLYDLQAEHLRASLGYALRPEQRGHGIASEAVGLAMRWAFGQLHVHRLEADSHPDNGASRALLERVGFTLEGVLRQRFVAGDEIQDSAIYGLLAPEWRSRVAAEAAARAS